ECAQNIKFLLYLYENMSGLKINFNKSEVIMVSQDDQKALNYAELLNCATGRWPMKYLGVPVSGTKLHIADWLFLDEKVLKRLEGWQGLQKPVDKIAMEQGAEALKESALFFHPCEATQAVTGMVLLH
ncbi:unnamed protein product, partial [Urochloa humidicola]